jgi:hypothetical protein
MDTLWKTFRNPATISPIVVCTAKTQRGVPCRAPAIVGGRVCQAHGGSAPQVKQAAMQRLLAAADPAAARLVEIVRSPKTETKDAIVAIRELFDRAGIRAEVPTAANVRHDGTILWEEFVQIHRLRFGDGTTNTTD